MAIEPLFAGLPIFNIVNTGGGNVPTSYAVSADDYSPDEFTTVAISAQLLDQVAAPLALAGRTVIWSSTNGGSFSAPHTDTNGSGIATVTFTVAAGGTTHVVTATDTNGITGFSATITVNAGMSFIHFDPAHFPRAHFPAVHFP